MTTTYAKELAADSRTSQTVVIMTLDKCSLVHGVGACVATQTGDAKCFNTRGSCNDPANFTDDGIGTDYKFSLNKTILPFPGLVTRPYLSKIPIYLATQLDPAKALTINARVTLSFIDEEDNDSLFNDPYFADRTYTEAPGTFWRKLIARNPHYKGRVVTIKEGFQGLTEASYSVRKFVIDQIDILKDGTVQVICKDYLKKADKAKIPVPTSGTIADDPLLIGAGTLNYTIDADRLTDYPEPGSGVDNFYIRVGDEIMEINDNDTSTKVMTIATRGVTIGSIVTVAAEHALGSQIQLCYVKSDINGVDLINDMLENYIPLDSSLIDATGFAQQKLDWYSSFVFTGVISSPIDVSKALQEVQESMMCNLWWSEEDLLVKLKAFAPPYPSEATATWTDELSLIDVAVDYNEKSRFSEIIVHYNKKVLDKEKEDTSYATFKPKKDSNSELSTEFGEPSVKDIHSRWIVTAGVATILANRMISRFSKPPKILKVNVELKDSGVKTADIVKVSTDVVLDFNGLTRSAVQYEVIKKSKETPSKFEYLLMDSGFNKRGMFIAPTGAPNYGSATDAQKKYAYIGSTGGNKVGLNEDGYYII